MDNDRVTPDAPSYWQVLRNLQKACGTTARSKGWWDRYEALWDNEQTLYLEFLPDFIGGKLMLVSTELAEALEEIRAGYTPSAYRIDASGKPEGFPIELADAVIRIMDLCEWLGIDLAGAIKMKMEYNETRAMRHGGKKL